MFLSTHTADHDVMVESWGEYLARVIEFAAWNGEAVKVRTTNGTYGYDMASKNAWVKGYDAKCLALLGDDLTMFVILREHVVGLELSCSEEDQESYTESFNYAEDPRYNPRHM